MNKIMSILKGKASLIFKLTLVLIFLAAYFMNSKQNQLRIVKWSGRIRDLFSTLPIFFHSFKQQKLNIKKYHTLLMMKFIQGYAFNLLAGELSMSLVEFLKSRIFEYLIGITLPLLPVFPQFVMVAYQYLSLPSLSVYIY